MKQTLTFKLALGVLLLAALVFAGSFAQTALARISNPSAKVDTSAFIASTRALTIAGTSNQIASSAGAQDLSADRTWTLSLPNLVIFPVAASSTRLSVFDTAYFGATATSSFNNAGVLTLAVDLSVANGGTGASTLTGILQGNGTSAFTAITGTVGQFLIFNGANTGTATSTIFVDTNEKVGIGSTTPQRKLSVGGATVTEECNLTDGATVTFNLSTCNQGRVVLGGNRTIDFTNETQALGQGIRFIVCQDGTGSRALTWDSVVLWAGGTAPTLTTAANSCDVIAGFTTLATGTPKILLDKALDF